MHVHYLSQAVQRPPPSAGVNEIGSTQPLQSNSVIEANSSKRS